MYLGEVTALEAVVEADVLVFDPSGLCHRRLEWSKDFGRTRVICACS
jgi:hypothetical protein